MSTILKALKKLEQERSGTTDHLSGQLAGHVQNRPESSRLRAGVLLVGGLLLGVLGACGGFLWMNAGTDDVPVAAMSSVDQPKQVPPEPARELVAEPVVRQADATSSPEPAGTASSSVESAAVPVAPERRSPATPPVAVIETVIAEPEPVMVAEAKTVVGQTVAVEVKEVSLPEDKVVSVESQQPPLSVVPEALHVSAIFFEQNGGSMAVVDDLPVMEGMMVNNVLVEKIFADKVHFRIDGTLLVIPLSTQ